MLWWPLSQRADVSLYAQGSECEFAYVGRSGSFCYSSKQGFPCSPNSAECVFLENPTHLFKAHMAIPLESSSSPALVFSWFSITHFLILCQPRHCSLPTFTYGSKFFKSLSHAFLSGLTSNYQLFLSAETNSYLGGMPLWRRRQ